MHRVLCHLQKKCRNRQNGSVVFRDVCRNDKDKMIKKSKEVITIKIRRVVTSGQGSPEVITKDKEVDRYF